jgi:squalene-hopene/tetraprenyl-beta-curcumene cyclase
VAAGEDARMAGPAARNYGGNRPVAARKVHYNPLVKKNLSIGVCGFVFATLAVVFATRSQAAAGDPMAWNPKAAAAYLDQRQDWWQKWQPAQRDHGTFCVSCHTAAPYALARPVLRRALGETRASASEVALQENVAKRVMMWNEVDPFYPDQTRGLPKTSESRGTESILNALVLASRDARSGALADDTRRAFDNLWALQFRAGDRSGAWAWLNFHYEPWEADNSSYYGAALAAIAVGIAPNNYAATPDIQDRLKGLREYLVRAGEAQSLFNRATLLWASTTWARAADGSRGSGRLAPLLTAEQQGAIVDAVLRARQDDGGWSMATLGSWQRGDNTPLDTRSDGYATGLLAYVLQAAGDSRAQPAVARARAWLVAHQDPTTGMWFAASLNKQRDPASDAGRFMSDAATAYAVLALTPAP